MILHDFDVDDDEDEDILLLFDQFCDYDNLEPEQQAKLNALHCKLIRENHNIVDKSLYTQLHKVKKDEHIHFRRTELSVESDTELDARPSLPDKETHGEFEHDIDEVENQEDLLVDEEDTEVSVEPNPELKTLQDDLPQGLDARCNGADKESRNGFKHKIEGKNQDSVYQDPFYPQCDIKKEDEDILHRLESDGGFMTEQNDNKNESTIESASESGNAADKFKKEQKDLYVCSKCHQSLADKESDSRIKQGMNEAIQKKLQDEVSHSPDNIKEAEDPLVQFVDSILAAVNACETQQNDLHRDRNLNCLRRVAERETDGRYKHKSIEGKKQKDLHKEDEDPKLQFMMSILEALNADEKEMHARSEGGLKPKMRTEKAELYDLGSLNELEEIVLKICLSIDHMLPMLSDSQKVRIELQDNLNSLQKVNNLLLSSSQSVNKLITELKRMKNDKHHHGKTQKIPEFYFKLVEINAHSVEESLNQGIECLFDNKYSKDDLSCCVNGLNQTRDNLGSVLSRIRQLCNAKRMEDERKRIVQKMKNRRCGFNASIASPKLPDGFER